MKQPNVQVNSLSEYVRANVVMLSGHNQNHMQSCILSFLLLLMSACSSSCDFLSECVRANVVMLSGHNQNDHRI